MGIAAAFGAMSVTLAVVGIVTNPLVLFVAAVFGVVTYLFWEHGSGRLASRVYRRVERQAAHNARTSNAGPREAWSGPHRRSGRRTGARRSTSRSQTGTPSSHEQAYHVLGLEPGATDDDVKRAYRERVKEVHPDADGGDEEAFKRVTRAYETLTDDRP